MEENQGAEQTPLQFAIRAIGYFLCKTVLQTAENICFVKTTRHPEATKGSSKHQTTKFTTFKHYSYTHGVNVKIKTEQCYSSKWQKK